MIIGSLIYLLQYSNLGLKQVSEREKSMQDSRQIIHHVVTTVRKGFIPENLAAQTSSDLKLIGEHGQSVHYLFDTSSKTLKVYSQLANEDGTLKAPVTLTFSEKVKSVLFHTADNKVEIELEVHLPNNGTQKTSTVVYSTQS
ncbi:hypothetical protein ACU063_01425 [Paenibacillus sp. M.A.Huq-81]